MPGLPTSPSSLLTRPLPCPATPPVRTPTPTPATARAHWSCSCRATHQCKVKLCVKNVIINLSPLRICGSSRGKVTPSCPHLYVNACLYFVCLFVYVNSLSVNYVKCHMRSKKKNVGIKGPRFHFKNTTHEHPRLHYVSMYTCRFAFVCGDRKPNCEAAVGASSGYYDLSEASK